MAKQLMDIQLDEDFEMYVLLKDSTKRVAKNGKTFCHWYFKINREKYLVSIGMLPRKMWHDSLPEKLFY